MRVFPLPVPIWVLPRGSLHAICVSLALSLIFIVYPHLLQLPHLYFSILLSSHSSVSNNFFPLSLLSPPAPVASSPQRTRAQPTSRSSLAELGDLVLSTGDPQIKAKLSHLDFSRWRNENLPVGFFDAPSSPARPIKPQLVTQKEIPAPRGSGLPLNAYMLHNLAHVELNTFDLAWDTVVRSSPLCEILGKG